LVNKPKINKTYWNMGLKLLVRDE